MIFVLQRESTDLDVDVLTLKEALKQQSIRHQYIELSLKEMKDFNFKKLFGKNLNSIIPVGSLDFVREFLRVNYEISNMSAIEIPNELRLPHLLNREYALLDYRDVEAIQGAKFLKYASELKAFSYSGDIPSFLKYNSLRPGVYVVSEPIDILAEYRVFVHRDKIVGIQFYDGNPLILISPENLRHIQETVVRYSVNKTRPKSYTLDIGVLDSNNISVIELHPWCSVGLYGCSGGFLPDAYADGFKWYVQHNTPLIADNPAPSIEDELSEIFLKE